MADTDYNLLTERFEVLDCFVQLISGANKLRLKTLQNVDPRFVWTHIERVSDDGKVFLNQQIAEHTVEMELRMTADEVDTASNPPTNVDTVSYYLYRKNLRNSVFLQVSQVMYAATSAGNKYARLNYSFELLSFGVPRMLDEGDVGLPISGRVLLVKPSDGTDCSPTLIRSAS